MDTARSSSINLFLICSTGTKVMITTGLPHSSATKTEILDVVSGETCVDLDDYPLYSRGAVGANLYGAPVVCGGAYDTYLQKCYKFINGGWQEFASMKNKRWLAAGVMYKKTFHVFGGLNINYIGLQTSEIISIDGGVDYGPDLPTGVFGHAITSVNATVSILTGGRTNADFFSRLTWYFNHETKTFSSGPSLLDTREGHGSATVVDKVTNAKIPIVAGGVANYLALNSTELLINGQWQSGTVQCKKATCFDLH